MTYGGWYPRRRGILDHLENGTVSLLDIAVHDVLSLWADHKTGVCRASAEKIHALCPADFSYKSIQRCLIKLERRAWIKRWHTRGRKGNYPILVCKYFVHDKNRDPSTTWWATNGAKTTDWRDVQFDPVHDPTFKPVYEGVHEVSIKCPPSVREGDPQVSTDQESIKNKEEGFRSEKKDFDARVSSSSSSSEKPIEDDDARALKNHLSNTNSQSSGNGHSNGQPKDPARKSPKLLAWVRRIVQQRTAGIGEGHSGVRDPSAYRAIAEKNFFIQLDEEIEKYLDSAIDDFVRAKLKPDPSAPIFETEIRELVQRYAQTYDWPITEEGINRAVEIATIQITFLRDELRRAWAN